jgi:hypothetical protein
MTKQPKRRVPMAFFLVPSGILLVTLVLSVLPIFTDAASFIYDPNFLRILYATLSLAIALFLFGFLGDSDALIKNDAGSGLVFQVGGSAAGCLIFFYFFSSGLNPYRDLTVYLLDGAGGTKRQLTQADGPIQLTIAADIERRTVSEGGVVYFRDLPRSEDWRLLIGGSWKPIGAEPNSCWLKNAEVSRRCSRIYLLLAKTSPCFRERSALLTEATPIVTSLDDQLQFFRQMMEDDGASLSIAYSRAINRAALHERRFSLSRHHSTAQPACLLLAEVEDAYNQAQPTDSVVVFASCRGIFVANGNDSPPPGEYKTCRD